MVENSKRVRVSIANLAWYAVTIEKNTRYPFAVLNPNKLKKGELQYMALGGGAMLNEAGKKMLEQRYAASDFELDTYTGFFDARFRVDETHLKSVFVLFADVHGPVKDYEKDRTLDIMAEITGKEFPGYERILDESDKCFVDCVYLRTVEQKPSAMDADTSTRASSDIPTRRLFRIFELRMPQSLYDRKLLHSPVVKILDDEELKTTDGGSKAGRTKDGFVMQNNLFYAP